MEKLIELIRVKLIYPVIQSTAPISEVSWGVAIGVFFALTPTVGVQMYLVALIWCICLYIFRFSFSLPVGVAMVWLSNPLTMIPLYYMFLVTGYWFLGTGEGMTYEHFSSTLSTLSETGSAWDVIVKSSYFLLVELGWPMVLGGFFYAIPGAALSFFTTQFFLLKHRQQKARLEGISYEEWRSKNENKKNYNID